AVSGWHRVDPRVAHSRSGYQGHRHLRKQRRPAFSGDERTRARGLSHEALRQTYFAHDAPPSPASPSIVRPIRILLVDDHAVVRNGVRFVIEKQPGWEIC